MAFIPETRAERPRRFRSPVPLALAAVAVGFAAPNANAQYFSPAAYYNAGASAASSLQAYDLNGDGKPDLVATSVTAGVISVSLNNGNGTFAARTDYSVLALTGSLAVQDMDGDGKPDLVASSRSGSPAVYSANVFINSGNGTFKPKVSYTTGGSPKLYDLNGDSRPDIVANNSSASAVSVLLNNGDGTFGAKTDYSVAFSFGSLNVQDLNGDGKLDIAVTSSNSGVFSVLVNNEDGTFKPKADYALAGTGATQFNFADLNGDARPDLVLLNNAYNQVSVLLNNGDGTFGARSDYSVAPGPTNTGSDSIYLQDLSGDGKPDILAGSYDANTVSVLINNGDGSFKPESGYDVGGLFRFVSKTAAGFFADYTGDGKPDLIALDIGAGTLGVSLNKGDGTFLARTDYALSGAGAGTLLIPQDLNGDGLLDILAFNYGGSTISVFINRGDGTFAAKTDYNIGGTNLSYTGAVLTSALQDVNGDSKPDLVTLDAAASAIKVALNNGAGGFPARTDYPVAAGSNSFFLLDLNGDGKLDMAAYNSVGTVSVLLNQPNYVPPMRNLLWQNGVGGDVAYWRMNATQYLNTVFVASGIPSEWRVVGYADLTGDGTPDILWQNYATGDAAYWQMNGGQRVSSVFLAYGVPLNWKIVAVADITGDGQPDLIWRDNNSGDVAYWQMNGPNYVSSGSIAAGIPLNWKIVAVADISGDGKNDLIWENTSVGDYAYWQMNGPQYVQTGSLASNIPLNWQIDAVGDITGDGKADLIWENTTFGDFYYWQMNGPQFVSSNPLTLGIPAGWKIVGIQ